MKNVCLAFVCIVIYLTREKKKYNKKHGRILIKYKYATEVNVPQTFTQC